MSKEQELITFRLTTSVPTTYQKEDGTFVDQPVSRKVMGEYTIYEKGKAVKYRHIKNSSSLLLKDQIENGEQFAYLRDEIYFSNGIVVLNSNRDRNTIEILRRSPQNVATPESSRPDGVEPIFEEVKKEKEGLSELDLTYVLHAARTLVMGLQKKNADGSFTYEESKIKFMSNIFGLDGDLSPAESIIDLLKKAESAPDQFIYKVETSISNFKSDLDKAKELGCLLIENNVVVFDPMGAKKVIAEFEPKTKEDDIMEKLVVFYSNPQNASEYKDLIANIKEAEAASLAKNK